MRLLGWRLPLKRGIHVPARRAELAHRGKASRHQAEQARDNEPECMPGWQEAPHVGMVTATGREVTCTK